MFRWYHYTPSIGGGDFKIVIEKLNEVVIILISVLVVWVIIKWPNV